MTELFFRHGEAFNGTPHIEDGKPVAILPRVCHRCGGLGGGEQWRHTGWTCFECGGKGTLGSKTHKLFTAEQLTKLNATRDKRAATKAVKAEAARAAAEAEANARRADFLAEHGALIAKAETFTERSEFIKDVVRKALDKAAITESQLVALEAAIARFEAGDAKKAASRCIGTIGERLTLTVTAERVVSIETQFGTMRIATMRDESGNAIVSKGRFVPPTANWDDDRGWVIEATPFTIKATVKDHDEFRGEKQTIIQRVTEV